MSFAIQSAVDHRDEWVPSFEARYTVVVVARAVLPFEGREGGGRMISFLLFGKKV
jgi:hypothetical protein